MDSSDAAVTKLETGQKAPSFKLKDEKGKTHAPTDVAKLVLYFYPKDFTPGCTLQIQDFSKEYAGYKAKGFEIYGVSPDSVDSHKKFCDAYNAPYPVLSDQDSAVAKSYGAYGNKGVFGFGVIRSTFVIENGVLTQVHYKVNPVSHAHDLLKTI
ncbi:peroxiredoxin [Candidatus Micrarchaeota archaeon]|nr:peroxiredoxin [Candidatus Micrarchaeota archaeon]